jgi:hypothetical protein
VLLTPLVSVLRTSHTAVLSNHTDRARSVTVHRFGRITVAANGFRVVALG